MPHGWVKNRTLVMEAAALIENMPKAYRFLFNAIFWDGERLRRYCTGPSSMNGHHSGDNGNLHHAVDVAKLMQQFCEARVLTNVGLGILVGLLHDAGKADEYRLSSSGDWILSDRGKLLGHKITIIEWIASAHARWNLLLPTEHYVALLHRLSCSAGAPEWLGIRKPSMFEAILLSDMDHLSGTDDLMARCAPASQHGWGAYHAHLKGQRPYVLPQDITESVCYAKE